MSRVNNSHPYDMSNESNRYIPPISLEEVKAFEHELWAKQLFGLPATLDIINGNIVCKSDIIPLNGDSSISLLCFPEIPHEIHIVHVQGTGENQQLIHYQYIKASVTRNSKKILIKGSRVVNNVEVDETCAVFYNGNLQRGTH